MEIIEGIDFENIIIGKNMGDCNYHILKEDILKYISNTGIDQSKFHYNNKLITPASMIYVYILKSIFNIKLPVGGAILVGHGLECYEPIIENETITVNVLIKDKYIKYDKKYVFLDFIIKGANGNTKVIDTMKAIWPK